MKKLTSVLISLSACMVSFAQTDSIKLNEVVVTGTRSAVDVRHLPTTVTVINRETLTEQHQSSILPTAMQEVPGLFVTSRSMMGYGVSGGAAGELFLRGLSGGAGQLLVLIDGHPQYQGIYGHPIADSYQTMMAERVEVLRGPASVLYGSNAMGGVINIVTRGMQENGIRTQINLGAGSWGTIQTEASNQIRSGKFSSTVAAQYGRSDNHRPRMGFEQYGGYLKLGYDFTPHWYANLEGNVNHFNASHPGSESSPLYDADQWITRAEGALSLENHYDRTSGALSVYSSYGRHKIDDGTDNPANPTARYFRSKDALIGVSWYQSAQFFTGNRITLGVDYQHIYGDAYYTSKQTGETLDTPNKQSGTSHRNEVAGYVDFRQDLGSWLTVDAGLRVDHHSITGTEWIPQFGIATRPTDATEFKMTASKGYRNPTMREMYLYPPSNEELEPERLWNYEVAWKHHVGSKFTYGLNGYYIKGDNLIQTVNRKNVNTGVIENFGAELEASYRISQHWTISTNHSYLHMEHPIVGAPEYKGYLGAHVNYGKWNVITGLQCLAGLYTEVGQKEQKECAYLLNATVNYQLCKLLRLWVRGENLLAQSYEFVQGYPMPRGTFMGGVNIAF